jgi:hypothetical protein
LLKLNADIKPFIEEELPKLGYTPLIFAGEKIYLYEKKAGKTKAMAKRLATLKAEILPIIHLDLPEAFERTG